MLKSKRNKKNVTRRPTYNSVNICNGVSLCDTEAEAKERVHDLNMITLIRC